MSVLWNAGDAAEATGGVAERDWAAGGVSIDTRTLEAGDLFVALRSERDGHDFVAAAFAKGAAAAIVTHRPPDVSAAAPLVVVPDVLEALTALGRAARARTDARVIAITGSAGKTSTKEMLRDVLAGQGRVHAAEASYNNHWGVPLTLARMPRETDFAIIEIGMNAPGEIAPLARLARPDVAIVTTVAAAHLAAFEDLAGIAREKGAIFEGLEPGGTAIFNADVETRDILAGAAKPHAATLIAFGTCGDAEVRLIEAKLSERATVVRSEIHGRPVLFKVGTPGRHFAMNALAVLAAAEAAGADPDIAATDLGRWAPPAGRGTRETLALDPVEERMTIDLIDDAFNANPASLAAALEVLEAARPVDDIGRVARGRRIAILGDMLELGQDELRFHAELARHPAMDSLALVHCVGPRMAALWEALPEPKRGQKVACAEELASRVHHLVDAGDVVLVKGSKGSRVSLVVEALRKLSHPRVTEDERE